MQSNVTHKIYPQDHSILMAEDNPDDIIITKRAWKNGRIQNPLYVVKNGEEAIEFLYKKGSYTDAPTPSLMLLDLKMPRMDGFEVLSKLKNDIRFRKMPIIVLTTSDRDKDIERAYQLGCNSYICKPVNFENFIKVVMDIQQYWLILCKIP
jgi:CheY-like chemotaxis protein